MKKAVVFSLVFLFSLFISCVDNNPISTPETNSGKIKRISQYSAEGELEFYLVFNYNTEGLKTKVLQYNSSDQLFGYNTFEYVKDMTISKQYAQLSLEGSFELSRSYISDHDQKGNEIKMLIYNASDQLIEYYVNEFNNENKIIKELMYNNLDKMEKYYLYKYNNKGENTYTFTYNNSDELFKYSKSEYDSKGNIVKETVFYEGIIIYYLVYQY